MPTVVLDAYSKAFPSITNRIRAAVFLETDLLAPVATIIDTTAGHPTRIYHFPGLPRANYAFSLDEIDGGGTPINNLAFFDVVPSAIEGFLTRADEQIRVDTTPGFSSGLSVVTFDGSGGSPDYRGWDIVPSELTGRGILVRGQDYSWDSTTGVMTWLIPGDTLQPNVVYNIHFNPINTSAGGSEPTIIDFQSRIVTVSGVIDLTDFGNTIIAEPAGTYIELTLPALSTVAQGRLLTIETKPVIGNSMFCVKILPNGSDTINFLRGNLYLMPNETLQIYRFRRDLSTNEWRVRFPDGNFKSVGRNVSEDYIQGGAISSQLMDGSSKDIFQYARIYNEHVLMLPLTQVVNYDDWASGNNKYFYSLANSVDPGNANKFHFPDRRGVFERNNNSGKAGDYADDSVKINADVKGLKVDGTNTLAQPPDNIGTGQPNIVEAFDIAPVASETQPKNYLINKYVLL